MAEIVSEFTIIEGYFKQKLIHKNISLGVGDDCALLTIPDGYELAITTDTMVENVHFFPDVLPYDLGYKLLAVNFSDLAAMGATPLAATLALTLPKVDESWLQAFADGFFTLANQYQVGLIGGDTTSGSLTLTVQAMGLVPQGQGLRRSTAQVGDVICVTGLLGEAGLGYKTKQGYSCSNPDNALMRFNRPEPCIEAGLSLLGIANSCIDISDGLAGDLGHILKQSGVGAVLEWDKLPLSDEVKAYIEKTGDWLMPLTAGDDYELCFTVSPDKVDKLSIPFFKIGVIESSWGLRLKKDNKVEVLQEKGYEHFNGENSVS